MHIRVLEYRRRKGFFSSTRGLEYHCRKEELFSKKFEKGLEYRRRKHLVAVSLDLLDSIRILVFRTTVTTFRLRFLVTG